MATFQGHIKRTRQHLQSTRPPPQISTDEHMDNIRKTIGKLKAETKDHDELKTKIEKEIIEDAFPTTNNPNTRKNDVLFTIVESSAKGMGYIGLKGIFPYKSARCNEYILVGYHYDANAILAESIKNRKAQTITQEWEKLNNQCSKAGIQPNTYIVDNEESNTLKEALCFNHTIS